MASSQSGLTYLEGAPATLILRTMEQRPEVRSRGKGGGQRPEMWTQTEAAETTTFPGAGEPGTPGGELFAYLSESRAVEPQRQGMPRVPPASGTYFGLALRTLGAPGPPLAKFVGHRCQGDNAGHAGKSGEPALRPSPRRKCARTQVGGKKSAGCNLTAATPEGTPPFLQRPRAGAPASPSRARSGATGFREPGFPVT